MSKCSVLHILCPQSRINTTLVKFYANYSNKVNTRLLKFGLNVHFCHKTEIKYLNNNLLKYFEDIFGYCVFFSDS